MEIGRKRQFQICSILLLLVGVGLVCWSHYIVGEESHQKKESVERPKAQPEEEQSLKTADISYNPMIRVLLKSTGYELEVHPSVSLVSEAGLTLTYGGKKEEIPPGQSLALLPDDSRFAAGSLRICAAGEKGRVTITSLQRGYGQPSYAGVLELYATAEGIAVVNELPLETYLCGVVPSEMPSDYDKEALKVQAVCARSYAYCQLPGCSYPQYQAQVDDSTAFQVYNNSGQKDTATEAVEATAGQVVTCQGCVVKAYYFSTSCGYTTDIRAWGTEQNEANTYLQSISVSRDGQDYERDLPWYRWTITESAEQMKNILELNTGTPLGALQSVNITKAGAGGVALELIAVGESGTVTVSGESNIRSALGSQENAVIRQDGSQVVGGALLPSAFITIEEADGTYVIHGGGYGHGIGMSQNGANCMAENGMDYVQILQKFYNGAQVQTAKK